MGEAFMARPTDVFISYLAAEGGTNEGDVQGSMLLGRIAMGLELITVMRILEEHQLMAEHEQMIACLQTLLVDQELAELAQHWYEALNDWRKPKFSVVGDDPQPASAPAAPGDVQPRLDSIRALLDSGQTKDPPSSP